MLRACLQRSGSLAGTVESTFNCFVWKYISRVKNGSRSKTMAYVLQLVLVLVESLLLQLIIPVFIYLDNVECRRHSGRKMFRNAVLSGVSVTIVDCVPDAVRC